MGRNNQLRGKNQVTEFTPITTTGTTSAAIDLEGRTIVGLRTPTYAASTVAITFLVAESLTGTYITLNDKDNAEYSITVDATSKQYFVEPFIFAGVGFVKIVTSESETAEVTTLITRPID